MGTHEYREAMLRALMGIENVRADIESILYHESPTAAQQVEVQVIYDLLVDAQYKIVEARTNAITPAGTTTPATCAACELKSTPDKCEQYRELYPEHCIKG